VNDPAGRAAGLVEELAAGTDSVRHAN
jgi:hypothetical protein